VSSIPDTLRDVIPPVPDRGRTLYEEFRAVLHYFPDFATRARQTYSWAQDDDQAIEFTWEAVIYSERSGDQARRGAFRNRLGALGLLDASGIEMFVHHILSVIGGEVRARRRRMTGVNYHTQQRFVPDASYLDKVRGEDRVRNRIRDEDSHVILDVRFEHYVAGQPAVTLNAERSAAPSDPGDNPSDEAMPADTAAGTATPQPKLSLALTATTTTPTSADFVASYLKDHPVYSFRGLLREKTTRGLHGAAGLGLTALQKLWEEWPHEPLKFRNTELEKLWREWPRNKPLTKNTGGYGSKG
jgi:hypothetical protein